MAKVVADASCLIALQHVGRLGLLQQLFGDGVVIPRAVQPEVAPTLPDMPEWIRVVDVAKPSRPELLAGRMGEGETEALALADEIEAKAVIVDDLAARRTARELGLRIVGTAGILVRAKQRGLIPAVRPVLDALLAAGFRLSAKVYGRILSAAGEGAAGP